MDLYRHAVRALEGGTARAVHIVTKRAPGSVHEADAAVLPHFRLDAMFGLEL